MPRPAPSLAPRTAKACSGGDPLSLFLERLAVLVPRPRVNLVLDHGVLAPRAAWRAEVVRRQTAAETANTSATETPAPTTESPSQREGGFRWADLMRRAIGSTS